MTGIETASGGHESKSLTLIVLNLRKIRKCVFLVYSFTSFCHLRMTLDLLRKSLIFGIKRTPWGSSWTSKQNSSKTAGDPHRIPLMSKTKAFQSYLVIPKMKIEDISYVFYRWKLAFANFYLINLIQVFWDLSRDIFSFFQFPAPSKVIKQKL